jgi:hypothetical protein
VDIAAADVGLRVHIMPYVFGVATCACMGCHGWSGKRCRPCSRYFLGKYSHMFKRVSPSLLKGIQRATRQTHLHHIYTINCK